MKTLCESESQTIILEGTVEKPTAADMDRVEKIRDELASRHEGGLIVHRSNKASQYKQLTIEWRSKPRLESET